MILIKRTAVCQSVPKSVGDTVVRDRCLLLSETLLTESWVGGCALGVGVKVPWKACRERVLRAGFSGRLQAPMYVRIRP